MTKTVVKYRTKKYIHRDPIEVVTCVRETEVSVFLYNGRREVRHAKVSEWERYHDSWQSARDYLIAREARNIEDAEQVLVMARKTFDAMTAIPEVQP